MLERPKHLPLCESETEEVKLARGESPEPAYRLWRTANTTTPRHCKLHRRTQLVLDEKESTHWPVYEHGGYPGLVTKPGEFNFRVRFFCPACRVAHARCPPEFQETSFDTFDTSTPPRAGTLAKAREFVAQVNERGCGFALFVGLPGSGKTRLACNIIRELKDKDTLYVRQGELTAALRATYGNHPAEYDENGERIDPENPLEIAQLARFLVLDELGCTYPANDERLLLDELLKHRYDQRKPTVLISNLPLVGTPDKPCLKEVLGEALTDRIKEATGNGKFIVQFSGGSFRRTTGDSYLAGLG